MARFSHKQLTAIHEAGHAVAAIAHGIHVEYAIIKSDLSGRVMWRPTKSNSAHSLLVALMAGPIAAHHAVGSPCTFSHYATDWKLIRALVGTKYNDETQSPTFQKALLAAWAFVRQRQHSIHRVAKLLLAKSTLRHSEIAQAM